MKEKRNIATFGSGDRPKLAVFFGTAPNQEFWQDIDALKRFPCAKQIDITRRMISWYQKDDVDKEWKRWTTGLRREEVDRRKHAMRVLLFFMRAQLLRHIDPSVVLRDMLTLGLPGKFSELFVKDVAVNESALRAKLCAEAASIPWLPEIYNVHWRVDRKLSDALYGTVSEVIVLLRLEYKSTSGETQALTFEFSEKGLEALIGTLQGAVSEVRRFKAK